MQQVNQPELEKRILKVSFNVGDVKKIFQDVRIKAEGTKFASSIKNECTVSVSNLTIGDRQFLTSEFSPFNRVNKPKTITIEAGRASTGTAVIYKGQFNQISLGQPPDVECIFKTSTLSISNLTLTNYSSPGTDNLSNLCDRVSQNLGLNLRFEADDKQINNYKYLGGAVDELSHIEQLADINAYVDDDDLIVKNSSQPLKGVKRILSENSGIVGKISRTERGISVRYLLDTSSKVGGELEIQSVFDNSLNGNYIIYQLGFELANREMPFYWNAYCFPLKR